jgi:proteasome lid subunit RPN8/RPN11
VIPSLWTTAPRRLSLSVSATDVVAALAERATEQEQCCALLGRIGGRDAEALEAIEVPNLYRQPGQFAVSAEQRDRLRDALRPRVSIVGFAHTHRSDVRPSATDVANARLYPYVWLIASRSNPRTWGAFTWCEDRLQPVALAFPAPRGASEEPA